MKDLHLLDSNPYAAPTTKLESAFDSLGKVKQSLARPASALMIMATIQSVFVAIVLVYETMNFLSNRRIWPPLAREPTLITEMLTLLLIMLHFVSLIAISVGAAKMRFLESYRMARFAAILACLPFVSPFMIFGIPFGIWSLRLLAKPEVIKAFQASSKDRMDPNPFQTPPTSSDLTSGSVSALRNDSPIAFYFGLVVVILGTVLLCVQFGLTVGLTFAAFSLGPLMLAWIPMWRYRSQRSQGVLMFADIAFLSWFLIYMQVASAYQNAFNAFAIGIYSFPVLLVLCIVAAWINRHDSLSPPIAVPAVSIAPPIAFYLGLVTVTVGTLMLCVHFGFVEGIFGLPIAFGPLMLAWIPMRLCRSKRSQGILVFANVAFACWFLYVYVPMRYPHNMSELDGLGMIAVGIYSFPVLLVLCIIAILFHRQDSRLPH